MAESPKNLQEIGWDSISLKLPAGWQPTVILKSYLLFELDGRPVCELKWQPTRGTFSAGSVLKRFRKTLGKDVAISEWTVPDIWQQALHSFTVSGFRLQQDTISCHGFLLFCPHCRRTTLLRFYFDPADDKESVSQILQSLADHGEKEEQLWSVYDIRALLPVHLELQSHEFLPGRFTLTFSKAGTTIILNRIKPAAVILKNQSLADFGITMGGRNQPISEGGNLVNFTYQARGIDLLLARLRRKPSWQWFRLSHIQEQNVILAVKAEGKGEKNAPMFDHISRNFTVTTPL